MSVWNFFDTEVVERFQVHLGLCSFELWDRHLSVVNCQECDQLLEVSDLLVCDFNAGLERKNVAFFLRLRLEETLHCRFALRQLEELLVVVSLFLLCVELCLHDWLSAVKSIKHSVNVEELTLEPYVSISIRILPFLWWNLPWSTPLLVQYLIRAISGRRFEWCIIWGHCYSP